MSNVKWREVGGRRESIPVEIKDEVGQITEGIYQGFVPIESRKYKGKINNLYFVEIDGIMSSFFGGAGLDTRLPEVKVGEMVRITYNGKKTLESGNKFHDFKVEAGEVVEGEEEPTPAVTKTKTVKKTAPKDVEEEDEDDDDVPF